jgi:hypothetical protein
MEEMAEIDPVRYGVLWQKVQDYERRFDEMGRKIDRMEEQLDKLVSMADRSKGGLWVGMSIVSVFSTIVGYIIHVVLGVK